MCWFSHDACIPNFTLLCGIRILYIQAIRVQQEVVHTDHQNAVIGVPGGRGILDNDDLLEGIIDPQQRMGFLPHSGFIGDRKSGLDIASSTE